MIITMALILLRRNEVGEQFLCKKLLLPAFMYLLIQIENLLTALNMYSIDQIHGILTISFAISLFFLVLNTIKPSIRRGDFD